MYDPNSAIPDEAKPALWRRYDAWRGERHIRFVRKHARDLMSWRNRRGYRRVVMAQMLSVSITLVATLISFFNNAWFLIPFLIGVTGTLVCQRILRIITGSVGDAPVSALDEIQVAQRNSARSIAFIVLFTLMFIPYFVLVAFSLADHVDGQLIYGSAILIVSLLLMAATLPSMLTAWWMADADPEDYPSTPSTDPAQAPHPAPYQD